MRSATSTDSEVEGEQRMVNGGRGPVVRIVAGTIIVAFVLVATVTTIVSVGRYCLTSDGAKTSSLPDYRG